MNNARTLAAAPFLIIGEAILNIGYHVAGAPHLNPFRRPS